MELSNLLKAVHKVRELSKPRKFKQSFDLIINLKDINLRSADQQIEFFTQLHYSRGTKTKICALVGPELESQAREIFDTTIPVSDFQKYANNRKAQKELASAHDFFVAQATVMAKVGQIFGKVFAPRGKMPNPKAGCVVPPNANLRPLYEKLQKTIKISAKQRPMIQLTVGKEDSKDEEVADNILTIYDQLVHHLPNEKHNIKSVYLKLTMGRPVKIAEDGSPIVKETNNNRQQKKSEPLNQKT